MRSLLGCTEDEALDFCRANGLEPAFRRTVAPRPFDGDVWRVVQQRQAPDGPLLVLAAFKSQPEEPQ